LNAAEVPHVAAGPHKYGVVAVIRRNDKWLVIRRSNQVRAPRKLCFPGGTVEPGESEQEALHREMREELGAEITSPACIWRSVTSWNVALTWFAAELTLEPNLAPNLAEVEEVIWLDMQTAMAHPDLLESAREFFEAYQRGEIPFA
jgi:8-oxo-dGTP diphosphatase